MLTGLRLPCPRHIAAAPACHLQCPLVLRLQCRTCWSQQPPDTKALSSKLSHCGHSQALSICVPSSALTPRVGTGWKWRISLSSSVLSSTNGLRLPQKGTAENSDSKDLSASKRSNLCLFLKTGPDSSPGWPGTLCVEEICVCVPPECWHQRHAPPCLVRSVLFFTYKKPYF